MRLEKIFVSTDILTQTSRSIWGNGDIHQNCIVHLLPLGTRSGLGAVARFPEAPVLETPQGGSIFPRDS